jgi:hypothetical protein
MRQLWLVIGLTIVATAGRALAQPVPGIENLRSKTVLGAEDRQQLRQWITATATAMVTNTDPDRRGMVAAREAIVAEGRREDNAGFRQAFGEEAIAVLQELQKKALSQDARVNLFMTVAELRRVESVPLLVAALEKDPYPASRYWGARGLNIVADAVIEKVQPRIEQEMSDAAGKAFEQTLAGVEALQLVEMLAKFDHERAHDVLADSITRFVQGAPASDPVASQVLMTAIGGLEKGYGREVRPEAKTLILSAYATLCVWIMPPAADPNLLPALNASLEKITGEKVGFLASDEPQVQKLALMEWAEKLYRDKKIPKRPLLPPAIEDAVSGLRFAAPASP